MSQLNKYSIINHNPIDKYYYILFLTIFQFFVYNVDLTRLNYIAVPAIWLYIYIYFSTNNNTLLGI